VLHFVRQPFAEGMRIEVADVMHVAGAHRTHDVIRFAMRIAFDKEVVVRPVVAAREQILE